MTRVRRLVFFSHNFRVKPVIALGNMTRSYFVKEQHKERSSSGKSPIGRQASNRHIPSASALSLINFIIKKKEPGKYVKRNTQNRIISRHEITVFPHDFRVKPVIALANITRYHFDEKATY